MGPWDHQKGVSCPVSSCSNPFPPSPSLFRDSSHKRLLRQDVDSLIQLGVVEEVLPECRGRGFYSHYFLIPKKKGGWRPIVGLHCLNTFIYYFKFHMVTLASVLSPLILQTDSWLSTFKRPHISVQPTRRKYLRFLQHLHGARNVHQSSSSSGHP